MAIDDAYLSVEEYRSYDAQITSDENDIGTLRDILGISRLIEENVGQFFTRDTAVVDRIFRAKWSDLLDLRYEGNCPGIATTAGLIVRTDEDGDGVYETTWDAADYELAPLNAALGPQAKPWTEIRAIGSKNFPISGMGRNIQGRKTKVTAIYGWPAVPETVKMLCGQWTKIWRLEGPEGTGRISEMGQVFSISLDVKRLQDRLIDSLNAGVAL